MLAMLALCFTPVAFAALLVVVSRMPARCRREERERVAALEAEHGFSLRF